MSMSILSDDGAPLHPDVELLVSYLDGELGSREREELEQRLMDDDALRGRLQELQSGWDWLDDLPKAPSNEKLVESTLELVVDDIMKKSSAKIVASPTRSRWYLVGAVLLGSLALGLLSFSLAQWRRSQQFDNELADLKYAEYLNAYVYGSDLSFMRTLESNRSWVSVIKTAHEVGVLNPQPAGLVSRVEVSELMGAIKSLELDDRAYLEQRFDRFKRLDPSEQEKIRQTAAAVHAKPDAESLLATMRDYAIWHASLPPSVQQQLNSGDEILRNAGLKKGIELTRSAIQSGKFLEDEDADRLYYALEQFLDERLIDQPDWKRILSAKDSRSKYRRHLTIRQMVGSDLVPGSPEGTSPISPISPISEQELEMLANLLTNEAKSNLDAILSLANFDFQQAALVETMRVWATEACNRKIRRSPEQPVAEWYRELDPDKRDALDLLTPDEMKVEWNRLRKGTRPLFRPPPSNRSSNRS